MHNPYKTLGIQDCVPMVDVRRAYRRLALQHHPDRGGSLEMMQAINAAYEQLMKHKETIDNRLKGRSVQGFTIIVGGWGTYNGSTDNGSSTGFSYSFHF